MLEELRQRLQALQRPPGLEDDPGMVPFGIEAIDHVLGGGLARGALHEIAAAGEAHLPTAAGFAAAVAGRTALPSPLPCGERSAQAVRRVRGIQSIDGRHPPHPTSRRSVDLSPPGRGNKTTVWIAEDMALAETGALCGPGLDAFGIAPERLVTVAAAHRRDLLWAMEEALRCRAVAAVIGEVRGGTIDGVAVRRLSLAAAESGALALLLRAAPTDDASTAATRWIIGAAPASPNAYGLGAPCFAAQLKRNRRGPTASWIIEWSESDGRFILATHAEPVAQPVLDRSHRKSA
jgi:protein ImuA